MTITVKLPSIAIEFFAVGITPHYPTICITLCTIQAQNRADFTAEGVTRGGINRVTSGGVA